MTEAFCQLDGVTCRTDEPLSRHTTFQLGGPAALLASCSRPDALCALLAATAEQSHSFMVIGEGSNLLVSDAGVNGVVVRYAEDEQPPRLEEERLHVSGAMHLDAIVHCAVEQHCAGLTFLSGIPGTVGGAICGNAGAFGQEIGDAVLELEITDRRGNRRTVRGEDIAFDYRRSPMQETGEIVLSAVLRVNPTDTDQRPERERILALRREKHPDWRHEPCAGSVFRNLAPPHPGARRQAAGWLLEQAGAKSMARGGACVYAKHANIVVKTDETCRAQDVYDLVRDMQAAVLDRFEIELEPEIRFIGAFETAVKDQIQHG